MSEGYLTAAKYGEAEYIDKHSRFIGRVIPIANEAEAKSRYDHLVKLVEMYSK